MTLISGTKVVPKSGANPVFVDADQGRIVVLEIRRKLRDATCPQSQQRRIAVSTFSRSRLRLEHDFVMN